MSDERLTELNAEIENTSDAGEYLGESWEAQLEGLNTRMLEETPKLLCKLYEHLWGLANGYSEVKECAKAAGEEKKLRSVMRREVKASYRKDLDVALKFQEWTLRLQDDIDIKMPGEGALNKIFSEVGLGVGFDLLKKLPDTYSKPNVPAIATDKKKKVSIAILEELLASVEVDEKGSHKNDIKLADVGHLIKMHCLPDVGDRVEYDKNIRGVAIESVGGEDGNFDGIAVKLDGSDEEVILLRGERKITSEKPAQLHEAALIRSNDPKIDSQTVVVKDWISKPGDWVEIQKEDGTSDKVQISEVFGEVLGLDGITLEIPANDLVKAPTKKSKVVGELLNLVSKGGALEKVAIAVERAEKPLLEKIDELNATLEVRYEESKLGDFKPESFNALPIAQRIEVFRAMPEPEQQEIFTAVVPPAVETKAIEINSELAIAIEANAVPFPESEKEETVPEPVIEVETVEPKTEPQSNELPAVEPVVVEPVVDAPVESEPEQQVQPEIQAVPELDIRIVESAEKLLLGAFNRYHLSIEEGSDRDVGRTIFTDLFKSDDKVKKFLNHPSGRYFLTAIHTMPWGMNRKDLKNWGFEDVAIVCDRINDVTKAELFNAVNLFKNGNKDELATLDKRVKQAAQSTLTPKERKVAIAKSKSSKPSAIPEFKTVHSEIKPNIEEIRDWLLTSTFFESAIGLIQVHNLTLEDVISVESLQSFCNANQAKADHTIQILKRLGRKDYLPFPIANAQEVVVVPVTQKIDDAKEEVNVFDVGF
ncbi:hypothetical protein QT972_09740 [Microcoleus sp. herbarium7]|uniref:hypothetical protein n=1 Tax=Microcoleus sp. herbarium7 TaxID=3055435 RepID=UPI002FD2188F